MITYNDADVIHACALCGKEFRISKLLFEHQHNYHYKQKISKMIETVVAAETYYSSDSDCDYQISVEIRKTHKKKKDYNTTVTCELNSQEGGQRIVEANPTCDPVYDEQQASDLETPLHEIDSADPEYEVLVEKLKCYCCPQSFTTTKNLKQHIKMYHIQESGTIELDLTNMQKFICPECNKELRDIRCLKKHLKLCHNLIIDGLIYNSCHKSRMPTQPAVVKNDLAEEFPIIRDRSPNSGKPRTQCGICGHGPVYGYTTIIKHQVRKHKRPKKDNDETYICGHCTKEFGNKENLSRHMKSHENARRYHCDMCSARFNTAILLRRHKLLHLHIKCGICNEEFQFRRQYRTHHRLKHPNAQKNVRVVQETTNNEIVFANEVPKVNQNRFFKTCEACFKTFKSKRGFKGHICKDYRTKGTSYSKDYQLDKAEHVEDIKTIYSIALPTTKSEVKYCPNCNKPFKSTKGFQQHRCKSIHLVQCPIVECRILLNSMAEYYEHIKTLHSDVSDDLVTPQINAEMQYSTIPEEVNDAVGIEIDNYEM